MKLDIELIQTEWIATKLIEPNMGQIPGVKSNPRRMRAAEYKKLVKSIEEDPEMLALNPCWVFPFDGRFVVLNGNQRCEVLARKKVEKAPCKVIPADTPVEKLNRYIVKINTHYGEWDWDMLANEWEATDLADWGVDFPQDWAKPEQPEPADSSEPDEPEAEERESIDAPPDLLYPSNNIMDVPVLLPNMQAGGVVLPVAPWGANSRMRNDVATYHCYVDDYRFTRLWREPQLLANSRCGAVVEPNFSLHDQTPIAWGLQAIYKKRWLARWWQEQGIKLYVDLFVAPKFAEYNLMGVPEGWNAFWTRGESYIEGRLEADLDIARRVSGMDKPNLTVYGGGAKIKEKCLQLDLLYIENFMTARHEEIKQLSNNQNN